MAENAAQQRGLTDPVGTDKRNFLSPFHLQVQRSGQRGIVADHEIFGFENQLAGSARGLEVELRLRFLPRELDNLHLVQLLLPGHRHIPRSHAGFVPRNEVLQIGNFLLLTFKSGFKLRLFRLVHLLEILVIPYITRQRLILHMVDQVNNAVQEWNVM
ncbi:hypothetical protein D3C76_1234200 [compost metagenome]